MEITLTFPEDQIDRFTKYVFDDQIPFVEARSVNDVAKLGQAAQRTHQREVFKTRRPAFVDSAVKIKQFARKGEPEARVRVEPFGGQKRASMISQHEADDQKTPIEGASIAVPTGVPRGTSGVIDRKFRPSRLFGPGSGARTSVRSRGNVVFGARGTYMIRKPGGRGTIFWRREGSKQAVAWYQLVPAVDLDQRLKFVDTVSRSAVDNWPSTFVRNFDRAIRTAR